MILANLVIWVFMLRKRLVAYALQGKNAILTLLLVGVANFFLPRLVKGGQILVCIERVNVWLSGGDRDFYYRLPIIVTNTSISYTTLPL